MGDHYILLPGLCGVYRGGFLLGIQTGGVGEERHCPDDYRCLPLCASVGLQALLLQRDPALFASTSTTSTVFLNIIHKQTNQNQIKKEDLLLYLFIYFLKL